MTIETGLPAVPEPDMFWRLKATRVELRRNLPDTDWGDSKWFIADTTADESSREMRESGRTKQYRYVKRSISVFSRDTKPTGATETKPGYYEMTTREVREALTRARAIKLANKILKAYTKAQSTKDLVGDYPPKRLPKEEA